VICLFIIYRKEYDITHFQQKYKRQQTSLHQFQNETYHHFLSMLCASMGYALAEKSIEKGLCKGHR
jgi:hypothetical protein